MINLHIHNYLRLRAIQLPEDLDVALPWYQDQEVLYYSEGEGTKPYDWSTIERMYSYLLTVGDVYMIEIHQAPHWHPIGDVTLSKEMLPIIIGEKAYRGIGVGRLVIAHLIKYARELGWNELKVKKIYIYNTPSIRLFTSLGFQNIADNFDEKGRAYHSYKLML
ncbi:GNAT family N-acetyltransferase [Paraliobacillus ryukyuensis]|uniref:GNAT family N-acetyltransferase n=1 Tax=Paraliobacillus ryukyuensis TaxID=200904 RepID=UPI0009A904B1|nr:GNAT family N-acetyltransferase [Paraliobacillus ryukyuensis]